MSLSNSQNNVCLLSRVQMLYTQFDTLLIHVFAWIGLLPLRWLLAWEFWESGLEKLHGSNWFADIQDRFPFPFNLLPVDLSWSIATWNEIIAGILLFLGLGTRFAAMSLLVVSYVAIVSVHLPAEWHSFAQLWMGYMITDMGGSGNFKLPLLFVVMLLPLCLYGGGKLSLDFFVRWWFDRRYGRPNDQRTA